MKIRDSRYPLLAKAKETNLKFQFIALFMVLTTHVGAQEAQGVAAENPTGGQQSQGDTSRQNGDIWKSALPVKIIEDPNQTSHTTEREIKSDKHEAEDLDAQVRAANAAEIGATATERQVTPTYAQAVFGFIGMLLLISTVIYTAKTYRLTVRSTRAQLRAYIFQNRFVINTHFDDSGVVFNFVVYIQNFGQTPARIKTSVASTRPVTDGNVDDITWLDSLNIDAPYVLPPGAERSIFRFNIPMADARKISNDYRLLYRTRIEYFEFMDDRIARCHTAEVFEVKTVADPGFIDKDMPPSAFFLFEAHSKGSSAT
jgi:hypothetical protein